MTTVHTEIRPEAQEQPPDAQPLGAVAQRVFDDLRLGLIEEAADIAIPFLVSVRQHARHGDAERLGECLKALWSAVLAMRGAYREIGSGGEGGAND